MVLKMRVNGIERTENLSQIAQLKIDMNDLEWRGRRLNLELYGIPKTDNKELLNKINAVAKKLDVPELTERDVVNVHRLPSKEGKVPGIIVQFSSQNVRDDWFDKRKISKRTQDKEFILESLTKQSQELHWHTREWAKEKNVEYVWHKNRKILIRKKDGERAIHNKSEEDLSALD